MRTVTLEQAYQAAKNHFYQRQWLYLWDLMQQAEVEHMGIFCRDVGISYQTFNTWERGDSQPSEINTNKIIEFFETKGIKAEYNLLRHNPNYLKREIRHQKNRISDTQTLVIKGEIISVHGIEPLKSKSEHN
jgi:DNA-binding XRE family transcriptional regulator